MSKLTDQEIIDRIRTGDAYSYSLLVDRYKSMVFTVAVRLLRIREDAEEVAQDTFCSAFKSLHSFRGECRFSTWLYRITYRKSLDQLRRRERQRTNEVVLAEESFQPGFIDRQMDRMDLQARKRIVKNAIGRLPEEDALLITLYYLSEQTLSEISEVMGLPVNTLKVRLFRSRKRLLVLLKDQLEPEIIQQYGG